MIVFHFFFFLLLLVVLLLDLLAGMCGEVIGWIANRARGFDLCDCHEGMHIALTHVEVFGGMSVGVIS